VNHVQPEEAVGPLFETLDWLDQRLVDRRSRIWTPIGRQYRGGLPRPISDICGSASVYVRVWQIVLQNPQNAVRPISRK
jgi:hypothetical protein